MAHRVEHHVQAVKAPLTGLDSGGKHTAAFLVSQGVETVFTLTGGHIAPILVGCREAGIRVVDVRDEAAAVFAADAAARLGVLPGVCIVTAGPGLTNTITALKNAQLAEAPVVILAGATSMLLKGRGSLQDIDQLALVRSHVKYAASVTRVRDIPHLLKTAFLHATSGVPGPVMVEFPLDTIWPEPVIREQVLRPKPFSFRPAAWVESAYLRYYLYTLFRGAYMPHAIQPLPTRAILDTSSSVQRHAHHVAARLAQARRPVLLLGSQAVMCPHQDRVKALVQALECIGAPVFLSGMSRGLLGAHSLQQIRHKRSNALRKADVVLLIGASCDFRVDYGRHIAPKAYFCMVNMSSSKLSQNNDIRQRQHAAKCDPLSFVHILGKVVRERSDWPACRARWERFHLSLLDTDRLRDAEIEQWAQRREDGYVNPVHLCQLINKHKADDAVIVADGGDFIGTASYIVRPSRPLSWLDPGVFGTLGVGGGFGLASKVARPNAEVWILFGDGSSAWSLAEVDTMVRHGLPAILVIGNDACWMQMYREQVAMYGNDVACALEYTRYDIVGKGYGAEGFHVTSEAAIPSVFQEAKRLVSEGKTVVINVELFRSNFRQGSISL